MKDDVFKPLCQCLTQVTFEGVGGGGVILLITSMMAVFLVVSTKIQILKPMR